MMRESAPLFESKTPLQEKLSGAAPDANRITTRVEKRVKKAGSGSPKEGTRQKEQLKTKLKASLVGALYFFTVMEGAVAVSKEEQEMEEQGVVTEEFEKKLSWPEKGTLSYDDMGPEDYRRAFNELPLGLQKILLPGLQGIDMREGTKEERRVNPLRFKSPELAKKLLPASGHVEYFGLPESQHIVLFTQAAKELPFNVERRTFFHELGHILHGNGNVEAITETWQKVMRESSREISEYPSYLAEEADKAREDFAETLARIFESPHALFENDSARFIAMRDHIRERMGDAEWDPRMDWVKRYVYFPDTSNEYMERKSNILEIDAVPKKTAPPPEDLSGEYIDENEY